MASYDVFNGDADGICALHQLRLARPRDSVLVTGVKRDTALLARVHVQSGDEVTVLDVSLAVNHEALMTALQAGARCLYFDHHFAGDIPTHPNLEAHIETAADVCTSLLVNAYLDGAFPAWAAVAAYGDNLPIQAAAVIPAGALAPAELAVLRELGECINYNAYGDTTEDLHFHPGELYRRLQPYPDPLAFASQDKTFEILQRAYQDDLREADNVSPALDTATHHLRILPDTSWARRVHGAFANRLAESHPDRAHAILVRRGPAFRVSVRAPTVRPAGAAELCNLFATGGGRASAAGIEALPTADLPRFQRAFQAAFGPSPTEP